MYDDDGYGCVGCLTLLIIAAVITWISDNWVTILLVVVAIIAIAAVIAGIKIYQEKAPERKAATKDKTDKEVAEKAREERESYDRYYIAQEEPNPAKKNTLTAFDVGQAMQDRLDDAILMDDFDTIRDMLDSGVISESDIDDVLEKVETSTF